MREPRALITTEDLAAEIGRGDVRVYDCTTFLHPTPVGSDDPFRNSIAVVKGTHFAFFVSAISGSAERILGNNNRCS